MKTLTLGKMIYLFTGEDSQFNDCDIEQIFGGKESWTALEILKNNKNELTSWSTLFFAVREEFLSEAVLIKFLRTELFLAAHLAKFTKLDGSHDADDKMDLISIINELSNSFDNIDYEFIERIIVFTTRVAGEANTVATKAKAFDGNLPPCFLDVGSSTYSQHDINSAYRNGMLQCQCDQIDRLIALLEAEESN